MTALYRTVQDVPGGCNCTVLYRVLYRPAVMNLSARVINCTVPRSSDNSPDYFQSRGPRAAAVRGAPTARAGRGSPTRGECKTVPASTVQYSARQYQPVQYSARQSKLVALRPRSACPPAAQIISRAPSRQRTRCVCSAIWA